MHGRGNKALQHFEQMCEVGMGGQPSDITFIYLLSACSHAGLVDEGTCCYASMVIGYMISTKLECYTCIANFLAMLAIYMRQRIWSWQCPINHMWLQGQLCLVLAKFMVMWKL